MRLRDSTPHDIGVAGFQHDRSDLLFEELGLLSPEEVDRVRERQHEADLPFTDAAKELGLLDQTTIDRALGEPSVQDGPEWAGHRAPSADLTPPTIAHGYAQQMKKLLSNLAGNHAVQRTPQRMVVTGVNTVSEASIVAVSMAMTCAASGFRVLLVDTNIERPAIHRQFGLSNAAGLSNLLAGSEAPHRFVQSTGVPNLALISAGPKLPTYSAMLARERLFHRLQPIASSFEYIIADCSALSPSIIGRLSTGVDNVLITVKEHVSSMRDLANMVDTLRAESVPDPAVLMIE